MKICDSKKLKIKKRLFRGYPIDEIVINIPKIIQKNWMKHIVVGWMRPYLDEQPSTMRGFITPMIVTIFGSLSKKNSKNITTWMVDKVSSVRLVVPVSTNHGVPRGRERGGGEIWFLNSGSEILRSTLSVANHD